MVRSCIYCGKYFERGSNRSFHKFPKDIQMRKLWMNILSLSERNVVSKYTNICSDHFSVSDFDIKPSGIKYLKSNAVPSLASTSKSLSFDYSWKSNEDSDKENTAIEENVQYQVEDEPVATLQSIYISQPSEQKMLDDPVDGSSSSTLTASPKHVSNSGTETAKESTSEESQIVEPPKKKLKLSNPRYFGDCASSDMDDPLKARRNWKIAKQTVRQQNTKIRQLQQTKRRLKSRIVCMNTLLNYLKKNNFISENAETALKATLPGAAADIMKRILKGPTRQKYDENLRCFALTLHFYSPKAYNFVRQKFNKSLPHPNTIGKWYRCVDGSPGFTGEAINALKMKVAAAESKNQKVLCNLVVDEIHIMSKIEWTGSKFTGYVDIGASFDSDELPKATQAIIFMVVALNDNWKMSVGYFLVNGLSGIERSNLVKKCLEFLMETEIIVTSLTFDGTVSNFNMAKQLGANFDDPYSLKTYFEHPINQQKIYIYLDPSHMLKLIRNCLGSQRVLMKSNSEKIDWLYIEELVNLQYCEGLHAATKLKKRHLLWVRGKMKVKIAAQTFSKSVSDALLYLCRDLKLAAFQGAEATAIFCQTFNDLFDIFNSRNRFVKYTYKKPFSSETEKDILKQLDFCKNYIYDLTLKGEPVLASGRKTGFLGFLICIESLKSMYNEYVKKDNALLKYLLTYKMSQDHLEIYFSAVRSRCGSGNNPTARQFESIYKKLLVHCEVKGAETANAVALDDTSILHCSSSTTMTRNDLGEDLMNSSEYLTIVRELNDHDYITSTAWHLTSYTEDVVAYIGGFVVRCLKKCVTCVKCLELLESRESLSLLQKRKQYGNLVKASVFVINICKVAEICIKMIREQLFSQKYRDVKQYLINSALRNLPNTVFDSFGNHLYDNDPLNDHAMGIVKLILKHYIDIRIHHETVKLHDSVTCRIRNVLTKTILFKNQ